MNFFTIRKLMTLREKPTSGLGFFAHNGHFFTFCILRPSKYCINSVSYYLGYLDSTLHKYVEMRFQRAKIAKFGKRAPINII